MVIAQQLLAIAGQGDQARFQHVVLVRDGQGLVRVLLDEEYRGAALVNLTNDAKDLLEPA